MHGNETMTPFKNTINGRLNANTSKWWERPKKQDSHSDQVHHLLEILEQGLVILQNSWILKPFTFGVKQRQTYVNIVNMLITALMTFALLDELFLWIRYRQLRQEAREAAERLIEVFEAQNNEHLYRTVL